MKESFSFARTEEADLARLEQVRGLSAGIARVLDLAVILAKSGRRIDLVGIDRKVGLLCAQALDLPPELGRELVPELRAQIATLDELTSLIRSARSSS